MLVASFIVPGAQIPAAIEEIYGGAKKVAELRSTYHTLKMQGIDDNKIAQTLAIQYGEGKLVGGVVNTSSEAGGNALYNVGLPNQYIEGGEKVFGTGATEVGGAYFK